MDIDALTLAAARAGAHAIRGAHAGPRAVVHDKRADGRDPVTAADRASEDAIRALIRANRAEDGWLGEESGPAPGTSGLRWVVDPLDGTVNFSHGLDRYAVSVALEAGPQRTLAAAVVLPGTGDWLALRTCGRVCGSRPRIGVTGVDPHRALLGFAVPSGSARRAAAYHLLAAVAGRVQDLRNLGSTVCDLAAVATGELDGFVTVDPWPWDLAAGVAMVRAAGGAAHRWRRRDGLDVVVVGGAGLTEAVHDWIGT